jgi:hypothetical protein
LEGAVDGGKGFPASTGHRAPFQASHHHVMQDTGGIQAGAAGHAPSVARWNGTIN